MKKYNLMLLSFLLWAAVLAGCSCQHEWQDATCTAPKTCAKCAATEGDVLAHNWKEADCVTPKTCSLCGITEGKPLGHNWEEATCTTAKTCSRCAVTEGQPLGHTWEGEATLYTAPVCAVCSAQGEPLPGYFARNGLMPNTQAYQAMDYTTNTNVRPDLDTIGIFLVSEVQVFESDKTHRAKKGYEWRSVDISILFSDNRSGLYGANVACTRGDYYQELELKQVTKKQERFTVTYNGKDYKCLANYENMGFTFTDTSNIFQLSFYVQVPTGYDGVVLAFYHGSIDINGRLLHEAEDDKMLLVRLA